MYSPLLALPAWVPAWVSPAMFILWMPGGFRLTCYYYRKAYYRAFFLDPPACAVGEPRDQYTGETRLLLFQNIHRYFLYIALVFIVILGYDAIHSFIWPTPDGGHTFGVSVGSLVLTTGATLLALYTFSCHSLRHLVGGNVDCFSCVRRRAGAVQDVARRDAAQRASHVLGLDEPVRRDARGFVCVDGGIGADS